MFLLFRKYKDICWLNKKQENISEKNKEENSNHNEVKTELNSVYNSLKKI